MGVACAEGEEEGEEEEEGFDEDVAIQPLRSNADITSNFEVNPATNFENLLDVRQINQEDADRIGLNDLSASLNSRFEENEEDYLA